ncbi:MAG: DUF2391 family protein [Candidatus Aenigmarchaeota archaeon]|nr:DUF2391 family protein [Candidatus Aenigmarchaeota archaeon]
MAKGYHLKARGRLSKRPVHYALMHGKVSYLALQDLVGAAFGAIFFAVTQEVWDLAARFAPWQTVSVGAGTFLMGYFLIYASRRRKAVTTRVYHHVFLRALEMYVLSFAVSALFVIVLGTAPYSVEPIIKQATLIAMPAMLSAATADLLFY